MVWALYEIGVCAGIRAVIIVFLGAYTCFKRLLVWSDRDFDKRGEHRARLKKRRREEKEPRNRGRISL